MTPHSPLGIHYLIECSGCKSELMNDCNLLGETLENCAREAGATVVKTLIHEFNPQGLSGIVVISESHLAVHTWPEHNYAAIDIFTCGVPELTEEIYKKILKEFTPKKHSLKIVERTIPK